MILICRKITVSILTASAIPYEGCTKYGLFPCSDKTRCIEGDKVCNCKSDCPDSSDEVDCPVYRMEMQCQSENN